MHELADKLPIWIHLKSNHDTGMFLLVVFLILAPIAKAIATLRKMESRLHKIQYLTALV